MRPLAHNMPPPSPMHLQSPAICRGGGGGITQMLEAGARSWIQETRLPVLLPESAEATLRNYPLLAALDEQLQDLAG